MYQVMLMNENGIKFTKTFASEYLFNKFVNKVKRSKKLKILSIWREY